MKLYYDLEKTPLEIKTDSEVGSNEKMVVYFLTAHGSYIGGVWIHFRSTVQYELDGCTSRTDFPTTLPSTKEKVFRLTLTRSSGVRLKIHCDGEEVLNVLISDTACSKRDWSKYWKRDVKTIKFGSHDSASKYYRAGKS